VPDKFFAIGIFIFCKISHDCSNAEATIVQKFHWMTRITPLLSWKLFICFQKNGESTLVSFSRVAILSRSRSVEQKTLAFDTRDPTWKMCTYHNSSLHFVTVEKRANTDWISLKTGVTFCLLGASHTKTGMQTDWQGGGIIRCSYLCYFYFVE